MSFLPKDYVKVVKRLQEYHAEHTEKMSIDTSFEINWDFVSFKATVVTKKWIFTGSSFGKTNKDKSFEKLETVAVWRALAFAWYSATDDIASQEEMDKYNEDTKMDTKFWDILDSMEIEDDIEHLKVLFEQGKELCTSEKMLDVLNICKEKAKKRLESTNNTVKNIANS